MTPHTTLQAPTLAGALRRSALLSLVGLTALIAAPQPASAGTYTVSGTCSWEPYNDSAPHLAVYATPSFGPCPVLVARNVQGNFSTPANGKSVGWRFTPPPGAALVGAKLTLGASGSHGWQGGLIEDGGAGALLFSCPDASCTGGSVFHQPGQWGLTGSAAVRTRVRCADPGGCPNGQIHGQVTVLDANVLIADATAPAVSAGGDLASGGWKGGTRQLTVDANDNVGIQETQALIDGNVAKAIRRGCNFGQKVPCPNGADILTLPLGGVSEGRHTLMVQAIDTAGNVGSRAQELYVDSTAPVAPVDAVVEGGAGWRSQNAWTVRWSNPPQQLAPIAGIRYSMCPPEADSNDRDVAAKARKRCVTGERSKANLTELTDLKLPGTGTFTLRLWLIDAAGNHNPDSATKITGLGYDATPPQVAGFAEQDPNEPARITVRASDEDAPITGGAIELRRRGAKAWQPLPTEPRPSGVTALVDDETLRKGRYHVRAVVANAAGLQQGTDRTTTGGEPMTLKLPIRLASRLRAGRLTGRTCRGHGATRRCRQKLRRNVPVALGRRITLRGRLVVRSKPVKNQPLEVWQRLSVAGAAWQRAGTVQTNARGRFRYKTAKGPARALRFRYPGTAHVRGDNATIRLRVQARSTLLLSRRRVINGEYVTFSGRLRGGLRPPGGVLVELQVRNRGKWRTFAQPRADATSGLWSYQHRFESVQTHARFRFRARVRRQASYPFATGHSRSVSVSVHGL